MTAQRTERLLNLVLCLMSAGRPVTREQVRAAVPGYADSPSDVAFERMFERDKEELRGMGIPVTAITSAEGEVLGYRIRREDYALPELTFTAAERAVLALAAQAWQRAALGSAAPGQAAPGQAAMGQAALRGLRKLESGAPVPAAVDEVGSLALIAEADPAVMDMWQAVRAGRPVTFDYRRPDQAAAQRRRLQPWGIVSWRGRWYVAGHDVERDAPRVFRLSRIVGSVHADGPPGAVRVPADVDLVAMVGPEPEAEPVGPPVRLRLAPGRAWSLRRLGTADPVDPDVVEVVGIAAPRLVAEIAAAGRDATVLSPPAIAQEVRDHLSRVLAAHPASAPDPEAAPDGPRSAAALDEPAAAPTGPRGGSRSAPGSAAGGRLSRLLALVPWLMAHDGVTLAEAARHFGVTEAQLADDLWLLVCSGLPGHGPDDLLDIQFWDEGGRIHVIDPQTLGRPLRLTADEVLALLVGLRLLQQVPGDHDRAALDSALVTLEEAAGLAAAPVDRVAVCVEAPPDVAELVAASLRDGRALRLEYVGAADDAVTDRVVDPRRLLVTHGRTYLEAWCRRAGAVRTFRLDRIVTATVLAEAARPPADEGPAGRVGPAVPASDADPAAATVPWLLAGEPVVLDLEPAARWVVEAYPIRSDRELAHGGRRVVMPVGDTAWLVRLVLRLGGQARVVAPAAAVRAVHDAAAAALLR